MVKYFVRCTTDWSGTESTEVVEAKDMEDAEHQARELAQNNYESFSNVWEEEQESIEADGGDWIDGEHYDWEVELYDPEKHDKYLVV